MPPGAGRQTVVFLKVLSKAATIASMRSACAFTTFLAVAMSGCSLVNPPPPLRPPLPANGCQPASVVKHNQAGIGYYKVRQLEAAKGEFLMAESRGPEGGE